MSFFLPIGAGLCLAFSWLVLIAEWDGRIWRLIAAVALAFLAVALFVISSLTSGQP